MSYTTAERERLKLRSLAINEMIRAVDPSLAPLRIGQDLSADERRMWEALLHLPEGALSWHRFSAEFRGYSVRQIAGALLGEAQGSSAPFQSPTETIRSILEFVDLRPNQTVWLTGSGDVQAELSALGVTIPHLRHVPVAGTLDRFGLAVMCRGPFHHKDVQSWLNALRRRPKFHGPMVMTTVSSNISGIASDLYSEREPIRAYVRSWRSS